MFIFVVVILLAAFAAGALVGYAAGFSNGISEHKAQLAAGEIQEELVALRLKNAELEEDLNFERRIQA